jgi:phosphoribosyl-ATP pyrophosphohydrolase/phosphoribosyl-AMP cyclohydrolase
VLDPADIRYDADGFVPVVIQDWNTGEVLTLAYANAQAVEKTRETGELHLWSRSRDELWHKGATSGNTQAVRPCASTATATRCSPWSSRPGRRATPARGRAFTTATPEATAPHEALPGLERTLKARQTERPEGSYTVQLLDDPKLIGAKVEEEAEEVARAAREETDDRVDEEAADVLYHLAVLLRSRDRDLADVQEVLDGRRR